MTTLSKSDKEKIVDDFGKDNKDTGAVEVQVALFSQRIKDITEHLKTHHKDFHSRLGMKKLISSRRSLLDYVKRIDANRYQKIISTLNLRR